MTSRRFFIRKDRMTSRRVVLEGDEHHHLSRVARIKPQDRVWLFDEEGSTYQAQVERIENDRTRLCILERRSGYPENKGPRITLASALLKSKAWEWVLQKGTELGTDAFIPVLAERGVTKVIPGTETRKLERWTRIAREAAKQCGRSRIPEISEPVPLSSLLGSSPPAGENLLLHEGAKTRLRDLALMQSHEREDRDDETREIWILVGPEGGWTKRETHDILERGFAAVSLGDLILRAETAAICSLVIVTQFWT